MTKEKQKFCGNCGNHNAYNYPDQVFCTRRFSKNINPVVQTLWCCGEWNPSSVVQTLWCCEEWNPSSQECYCVEEAVKTKR